VGPRDGLNILQKRKVIPQLGLKCRIVQPVAYSLYQLCYPSFCVHTFCKPQAFKQGWEVSILLRSVHSLQWKLCGRDTSRHNFGYVVTVFVVFPSLLTYLQNWLVSQLWMKLLWENLIFWAVMSRRGKVPACSFVIQLNRRQHDSSNIWELKALKAHAADSLRTGSEVTIFSLTISMLLVNHVYLISGMKIW